MDFNHYFAVIMAGGGGTRLWPLSRRKRPKQLLEFFQNRSLFQLAVDRLAKLFPDERILVVTAADQAEELMKQAPQLKKENFLIEPEPKGTAAVVGFAASVLKSRDSEAIMAILTADHFIENVSGFQDILKAAYLAASDNWLVTLGIQPTFPSTGYGYIQKGERLNDYLGFRLFRTKKFKEKPVVDQANEFIKNGDHDWNSGMFFWKASLILAEISRQMPDLAKVLSEIEKTWNVADSQDEFKRTWITIKPQTIDYGIMENANNVAVIPAENLGWNDVGSWDTFYELIPGDQSANITLKGSTLSENSHGILVCTDDVEKLVVVMGVNDLVVVDTADALLVCKREDVQNIRKIVDKLKETGQTRLL